MIVKVSSNFSHCLLIVACCKTFPSLEFLLMTSSAISQRQRQLDFNHKTVYFKKSEVLQPLPLRQPHLCAGSRSDSPDWSSCHLQPSTWWSTHCYSAGQGCCRLLCWRNTLYGARFPPPQQQYRTEHHGLHAMIPLLSFCHRSVELSH